MGPHRRIDGGYLFLLWSLALSAFTLVLIAGYYPFFNRSLRVTQFSFERAQALAAAEAGVEDALWELNQNALDRIDLAASLYGQSCSATPAACYVDLNGDNIINHFNDITPLIQNAGGWFSDLGQIGWTVCADLPSMCFERTNQTLKAGDGSNATIGTYTAKVKGVGAKLTTVAPYSYYVEGVGPPQLQIISVGTAAGRQTTIQAVLERTNSDFRYAALGHHQVVVQGKVTIDSYDSTLGVYGGSNVGSNGDIGTNAAEPAVGEDLIVSLTDNFTPPFRVNGKAYHTPTTTKRIDGLGTSDSDVTGGTPADYTDDTVAQMDQKLPHVQIPSSLIGLPWPTTLPPGVTNLGNGNYNISGGYTWTCNAPMRVRSLHVGGTFVMADGCDLFVDNSTGTQNDTSRILQTPGSGQIRKTATNTTKIFVRDTAFRMGGVTWDSAILEADRKPERLQIYQTCYGSSPCSSVFPLSSELSQAKSLDGAFYGVVYVENGVLTVNQGNRNGNSYDSEYHGAFVAGTQLIVSDNNTDKNVLVHYDEALRGLALNGTGRSPADTANGPPRKLWRIKSWKVTQN